MLHFEKLKSEIFGDKSAYSVKHDCMILAEVEATISL
jgi:hypothetical protein